MLFVYPWNFTGTFGRSTFASLAPRAHFLRRDKSFSQPLLHKGEKCPVSMWAVRITSVLCGETTFTSRKRALTPVIKGTEVHYFGCNVRDQDKSWASHVRCMSYQSKLNAWVNRKGCCMPSALPIIWREPTNHLTDSLFYIVSPIQKGIIMSKRDSGIPKYNIVYSSSASL